ncbi:MAG: SDR family oxidoreductase [Pseudomonadota bacterium]
MVNHLHCVGYGYTARAVARRLDRNRWTVSGTTRDGARAAALRQDEVKPVLWPDDAASAAAASHLLISVPPSKPDQETTAPCPALGALAPLLADAPGVRWIGYLSSNGVYGDHGGGWVDEDTPANPTTPRGRRRLAAETAWRDFTRTQPMPVEATILRLPGIYGPGRSALDSVRSGTAKRIIKQGQVFSRMHVDDIARAVIRAMTIEPAETLFNLCDDEPAPPQDVISFACDLLGVTPPPIQSLAQADLSPMGLSFYADNKRVRNQRMKDRLGITLHYPSYREGLTALFEASRET